jgi:aryl-alcohol dehydrogenase-like predicted oxidoreductase
VILGVKNREELSECVEAERIPRLTDSQCKQIEAACA